MGRKSPRFSLGLVLVGMLGLAAMPSLAAPISWRHQVQDAVSEASTSGKPLLVSVSTDWCHYCKKMDQETLSDARVAAHIQNCFVPLKVDGDADRELVRLLGVQSFPTMVILSPKMKVLTTLKGFRTANQLNAALESICKAEEKTGSIDRVASTGPQPSPFGTHCPVTSFHAKRLVKSSPEFRLMHRGFDVSFASDEARARFVASPDQYWPLLDGHCVVSALDENVLRRGTWGYGVSFADRIWFLSSEEHMQRFSEKPHEYLQRLVELMQENAAESRISANR